MTIDERCQKLPLIKSHKSNWGGGTENIGVYYLPFPIYSDSVSEWIHAFYDLELADLDYIENGNSIEDKDINSLTRDELLTKMTALIRGERFCDGLIATALEDGSLEKMSERLYELTLSSKTDFSEITTYIDKTIKEIWVSEIARDYSEHYLLKEDCLKNSFYFHLRTKLSDYLKANNLRIYTEYYISVLGYYADLAIVQINPESEETHLKDWVTNVIALFEFKYKGGYSKITESVIKSDIIKLKRYVQNSDLQCQFYLAVIYETECWALNWLDKRQTNNWASNRVTELDAGYIDGNMVFEINSYNGLN